MKNLIVAFLVSMSFYGFTNESFAEGVNPSKGVGPVKEMKLEALSLDKATQGKDLFANKCSACHKMTERYVGPNLGDVFKRRTPEWIANMILNPLEMTQKDEAAKELLGEFLVQMTFQNVTKEEATKIVEYFRYYSEKGEIAPAAAPGKAEKDKTSKDKATKGKTKK